jgi:acetyl-CoA acyltransferase
MARENREVVFVDGVRTPFGKAGSMYAETRADDLVVDCIRELLRRHPELPPERIDDVAIAATTQTGDQGLTIGRSAACWRACRDRYPALRSTVCVRGL